MKRRVAFVLVLALLLLPTALAAAGGGGLDTGPPVQSQLDEIAFASQYAAGSGLASTSAHNEGIIVLGGQSATAVASDSVSPSDHFAIALTGVGTPGYTAQLWTANANNQGMFVGYENYLSNMTASGRPYDGYTSVGSGYDHSAQRRMLVRDTGNQRRPA